MGKKRIYELAKEINQSSKEVVAKAQSLGITVKNHMGAINEADEGKIRQAFAPKKAPVKPSAAHKPTPTPQPAQRSQMKDNNASKTNGTTPQRDNRNNNQSRPQGNNQNRNKQNPVNRDNQASGNQGSRNNEGNRNRSQNQNQSRNTNQNANRANNQGNSSNQNRNNQNRNNQNRPQGAGQNRDNQNRSQGTNNAQGQNRNTNQNANRNNNNRPQGQNSNRPSNTQGANQNRNNNQNTNRNNTSANQGGQSNQNRNANSQRSFSNNNERTNRSEDSGNRFNSNNRSNQNRNNQYGNQNRNKFNKKGKKGRQQVATKPAVPPRKFRELPEVLEYTDGMNVAEISKKLHREPAEIIKKLFMVGVMVNQNQPLDKDTIEILAADYGIEAQEKIQEDIADIDKYFEDDDVNPEKLINRPPVVTIMGHVDHGKTTLLDKLRHTHVTQGEAGGITQHIGAYQIEIDGKPITFLDTPGHAAFTSMRARGASITDITILVVAADDGVMPQTVEAINHAKAANVPIIVAVNKIDKPGANPDHVMQELSEHELIPEAWGGDTIFVNISAKFGQNIDELLEMILLVAEMEDLKADPTARPIGTVIEARLDKGKGPVATLLVQQGTLKVGDPIVVGNTFGRVRVMANATGRREKVAGPATPVEITGLNDVPQAGDHFAVFEDEKTARAAGEERAKRALLEHRAVSSRVTLDNLFESLKEGELKEVNVIIKADVQGSAEALSASLQKIEVAGVRVKIVHSAVGAINESDVTLAAASNAIIIGFNVRPTPQAKIQAEQEEVDIRLHRIIYKVIDEIETAMQGMLDPEFEEKIIGQMIVRELYKVSKVGTIAGCYVTDGAIRRDAGVRVIRDSIVIFEGKLASLKRFKDDAKEVTKGFECGAMIENFNDLHVDDVIEAFVMEEIKK
ncbi:translation initiation factor IF-2 [Enterococcus nangangensis]|uniref:translation initiation factor IF-2 n=1 Tax=Enterococcus nangangensis TaxID=2559926 RepID=UPI0010F4355D|nr:translation initiation factor IF-2 [Enterococcus nangangensis]